jgi:hypothetical protein
VIVMGADNTDALADIPRLIPRMRRNGSIWVVDPKWKHFIREADVLAAGSLAGLVDVKVVSFL